MDEAPTNPADPDPTDPAMRPVKRIELVIDHGDLERVVQTLHDRGVDHYTVINDVGGMGSRGRRGGDPFSGVFDNVYVLVACDATTASDVIASIRPILSRMGGICMVSDAGWVEH
jgi:nitrogen regulatory protein PII